MEILTLTGIGAAACLAVMVVSVVVTSVIDFVIDMA